MKSRNNIYYDLKHSPYRTNCGGNVLVFSSKMHLDKFNDLFYSHYEKIALSLSKRFGFDILCYRISEIALYIKIETRGFLIITKDGVEITCKENIVLDGNNQIRPICNEPLGTLTQKSTTFEKQDQS
jgi:hypothetical protein